MAMRNFWLETKVDGRKSILTGGPRNKDGGMTTKLYVRDCGESVLAYKIVCRECAHDLIIMIYDAEGHLIHKTHTTR